MTAYIQPGNGELGLLRTRFPAASLSTAQAPESGSRSVGLDTTRAPKIGTHSNGIR